MEASGLATPTPTQSLEALLDACRKGSEVGWRRLFNDYSPLLYRSILSVGAPREVAEDVVRGPPGRLFDCPPSAPPPAVPDGA